MPTSTLSGEAERPQVADAVIEAHNSAIMLTYSCIWHWFSVMGTVLPFAIIPYAI